MASAVDNDDPNFDLDDEDEEEGGNNDDTFPSDIVMITDDSLAVVHRTSGSSNNSRRPYRTSTPSVATTAELASSVGSVMMAEKEAFLKSFTIVKPTDQEGRDGEENEVPAMDWGITFRTDVGGSRSRLFPRRDKATKLYIDSVNENGMFALSRIRQGDYIKTINGRKVGPSLMNGELMLRRMQKLWDREGVLSISTKNTEEEADDVLVHATIIKPKPGMTYEDLGMVVWFWGYLVIKEFKKESIFRHTVLKETDNIVAINEINCEDMRPPEFARVISALPHDVTITVLRRKQRITGKFG